jgi:hypothetical protein
MSRARFRIALRCIVLAVSIWIGGEGVWFAPLALLPTAFASGPPPCPSYTDSFTGTTITGWTQVAGSWSQSSTLTTSSTSGLIIYNSAVGSAGIASISIPRAAGARVRYARIIGAYVDSNNYIFGQLDFDDTTGSADGYVTAILEIYSRSGGTNTLLEKSREQTDRTDANLTLCWTGNSVKLTLGVNVTNYTIGGYASTTGTQSGLGTGANATNIVFDNFSTSGNNTTNSNCSTCKECRFASAAGLPATVDVTLPSAWSNKIDPPNCETCATVFNGNTFVLDLVTDFTSLVNRASAQGGNGYASCLWTFVNTSGCIDSFGTPLRVDILAWIVEENATDQFRLYASARLRDGGANDWWMYRSASAINNMADISGQSFTLDYFSRGGTGSSIGCGSGSFNTGAPGTIQVDT